MRTNRGTTVFAIANQNFTIDFLVPELASSLFDNAVKMLCASGTINVVTPNITPTLTFCRQKFGHALIFSIGLFQLSKSFKTSKGSKVLNSSESVSSDSWKNFEFLKGVNFYH